MDSDKIYYAYYIVGINDDNTGFQHRLPWKPEGEYENKSLKEIIDEVFGYKYGFKRVQGDVIAREVTVAKNIKRVEKENLKYVFETQNDVLELYKTEYVRIYVNDELVKEYSDNLSRSVLNEVILRKDLMLYAAKIHTYKHGILIAENPIIKYKNDEILSLHDKTIAIYNENKNGSVKIKFNFYYAECINAYEKLESEEPLITTNVVISCENERYNQPIEFFSRTYKLIRYFDDDYDENDNVVGIIGKSGDHVVHASDCINKCLAFEGPIEIDHSQHKKINFGEKGRYYQIGVAVRHKAELNND